MRCLETLCSNGLGENPLPARARRTHTAAVFQYPDSRTDSCATVSRSNRAAIFCCVSLSRRRLCSVYSYDICETTKERGTVDLLAGDAGCDGILARSSIRRQPQRCHDRRKSRYQCHQDFRSTRSPGVKRQAIGWRPDFRRDGRAGEQRISVCAGYGQHHGR